MWVRRLILNLVKPPLQKAGVAAFAAFLLLLANLSLAQPAATEERFIADVQLHTAEELGALLQRAEALLLEGRLPQDGVPRVAFVLHGPEVRVLLRQSYLDNKQLVDLAASLSALGVVEIKACETWMGGNSVDPSALQPFVQTVSYGPGEIRRLVRDEGYIRF